MWQKPWGSKTFWESRDQDSSPHPASKHNYGKLRQALSLSLSCPTCKIGAEMISKALPAVAEQWDRAQASSADRPPELA